MDRKMENQEKDKNGNQGSSGHGGSRKRSSFLSWTLSLEWMQSFPILEAMYSDAVLGGRNLVGSAWVLCLTSEQVNVGHHGSRGAVRTKNGSWVAAQKMVKSEDGQGASVAGVGKEGRRTHNASLFTRVSSVDLRSWMEADDLLR